MIKENAPLILPFKIFLLKTVLVISSKTNSITNEYIQLYNEIAENSVDSSISVKPTHIGLDISIDLALKNFKKIINKASKSSNFLRIDMESSKNTDSTFKIYDDLFKIYS